MLYTREKKSKNYVIFSSIVVVATAVLCKGKRK